MKPECVFCDRKFRTWQRLSEHLVRHHNKTRLKHDGLFLWSAGPAQGHTVWCWCGKSFLYKQCGFKGTTFGNHLQLCGGMAAHIMQVQFCLSLRREHGAKA